MYIIVTLQQNDYCLIPQKPLTLYNFTCGRSSVVERLVANEKVVGSSPIARSKKQIYGRPIKKKVYTLRGRYSVI